MRMKPWNNWVHCTGSTYGTWLRGDPRGWRARDHREHCEGDYKHRPTPGQFERLFEQSKRLMERPGVRLAPDARVVACGEMLRTLRFHGVEVVAICVGAIHWHALGRFFPLAGMCLPAKACRTRAPRHLMGIAKTRSARLLSEFGLLPPGGAWARGCGRRWIRDRRHQVTVVEYILKHRREGAACWTVIGSTFDLEQVPSRFAPEGVEAREEPVSAQAPEVWVPKR